MKKRLRLSNNFALRRCTRRVCTPEDLISQLPDHILVYILSFLSLKEAADTSLISRRWSSLWRYIPQLDFDAANALMQVTTDRKLWWKKHMRKYVRWVNCTMQMCKVERLDQFRVRFDLGKSVQRHIDKWIEFAFARQVQRLELDLSYRGEDLRGNDDCYTFPSQLITLSDNAHLNDLHKLPPLWNDFKSLKVLLLKSVKVTGEVLEFFLHNCPFLEEMVVHDSKTLVSLEVVGPSLKLKHLEIMWCFNVESLKICDTNLVTLKTSAGSELSLSNVPMLIEVEIKGSQHILDDVLCWLSCVLSQLEVLMLHSGHGLEYKQYKFPELTKLKKFVLLVYECDDMILLGCTDVVEAAPQLKEFEIRLVWFEPWKSTREYRKAVGRPHHHLKVLRFVGYHAGLCVLELLRYFLESAIALEKIIVDPRCQSCPTIFLSSPAVIEEARRAGNEAKVQLEAELPLHIELEIL